MNKIYRRLTFSQCGEDSWNAYIGAVANEICQELAEEAEAVGGRRWEDDWRFALRGALRCALRVGV